MITPLLGMRPVFAMQKIIIVPDDYATIQAAIDAASSEDNVFVRCGTYHEHLLIDKPLKLVGSDVQTTIIDSGGRDVVTIKAENVEVVNFTIEAFNQPNIYNLEGTFYGVYLCSTNNCRINGNIVRHSLAGIYLKDSANNTIADNLIVDNFGGVMLERSPYTRLSDNEVRINASLMIVGAGFSVSGTEVKHYAQYVDSTNIVNGKTICYWTERENETVPSDAGDVTLVNCRSVVVRGVNADVSLINTTGSTITDCNMQSSSNIYLWFSNDNTICRNSLAGNEGIQLTVSHRNLICWNNVTGGGNIAIGSSANNTIHENGISGTKIAINLENCVNNTLSENSITCCTQGIFLSNSAQNSILRNHVTETKISIAFGRSCHNSICGNHVENNSEGITLVDSSDNNSASENIVIRNRFGLSILQSYNNTVTANQLESNSELGIWLCLTSDNMLQKNTFSNNSKGLVLFMASRNSICHNNFVNNTRNVYEHAYDNPNVAESLNVWDDDYPSGGNYWSDYDGNDLFSGLYQNETGSDGIGDHPHSIGQINTDRYPLMAPITDFQITTQNGEIYDIELSGDSVISNFRLDLANATMDFEVYGKEEYGHCRIAIPSMLVHSLWGDEYALLVDGERPSVADNWTDGNKVYLYVAYEHSQHRLMVVSEYASIIIIHFAIIAVAFFLIVSRKRLKH